MKYLGIDYSMRKVGLAIGESDSRIAVPLEVIPGGDDVLDRIIKLAKEEKIDAFVVGIPVPVHEEQPLVQFERVKTFVERLKEVSGLPVHEIDEVMTTREAKRVQSEYGSKVGEDALAAMMILQEHLDEGLK
ncbi:MAG: Holliday junction resolvase RuvX [Patescibacteria group bacterium]